MKVWNLEVKMRFHENVQLSVKLSILIIIIIFSLNVSFVFFSLGYAAIPQIWPVAL